VTTRNDARWRRQCRREPVSLNVPLAAVKVVAEFFNEFKRRTL